MRSLLLVVGALALLLVGAAVLLTIGSRLEPVEAPGREDPRSIAADEPPHDSRPEAGALQPEDLMAEAPRRAAREEAAAGDADRATLRIRVLTQEDDRPLRDVDVGVWADSLETGVADGSVGGSEQRIGQGTGTDEDGWVELDVPAGAPLRALARSDGRRHGSAEQRVEPLQPSETRVVVLRVPTSPDLRMVVRVLDAESGLPLAQASAEARPVQDIPRERRGTGGPVALADAAGFVEVEIRSWESAALRVEAPERAWTLVPLVAGHETRATAVEVRLQRSATVEALVLGPGRVPLADVQVRLSTDQYRLVHGDLFTGHHFFSSRQSWSSRTGGDGRCTIRDVSPRVPLTVEVVESGSARRALSEEIVLEPGERRTLELSPGTGGVLAGLAGRPGGAAASGVRIWLKPRSSTFMRVFQAHDTEGVRRATTDGAGRFRFEDVPDGAWLVGPSPQEPFAPFAEAVEVAGGVADRAVVLLLHDDLFIEGAVLDPSGAPIQQGTVFVWASSAELDAFVNAQADAGGRFRLGPLAPGRYDLRASGHFDPGGASFADSEAVAVEAGASGVELRLQAGGRLQGRLVDDATGEPLRGRVTLSSAEPGEPSGTLSISGAGEDGEFEFRGLRPGAYDLAGCSDGRGCALLSGVRVELSSTVEGLVLRVRPGGQLSVRYAGVETHMSVQVLLDGVVVAVDGVERGTAATWTVPAGTLEVVAHEFGGAEPRESRQTVALAVGEHAEVAFFAEQRPPR